MTMKIADDTPANETISFGAIRSNGAPRSRGMLITVNRLGITSTDATLSGLALEGASGGEAIALSPAFDAATYTYTASVVNRIDAVKLATQPSANVTVSVSSSDTGAATVSPRA